MQAWSGSIEATVSPATAMIVTVARRTTAVTLSAIEEAVLNAIVSSRQVRTIMPSDTEKR